MPLLLVLLLIGNEEAVGSIKALTGILSAAMIFTMSKRVKHKHHVGLVGVWLAASLLGAVAFAAFVSIPTAMAFFIGITHGAGGRLSSSQISRALL